MSYIIAGEIVYGNVKIPLDIQIKYTGEKIHNLVYVLIKMEMKQEWTILPQENKFM